MSEEKKELLDQVSEKATEAFDKAKEVGVNVAEKFKASSVGKELLGEDGKLAESPMIRANKGTEKRILENRKTIFPLPMKITKTSLPKKASW